MESSSASRAKFLLGAGNEALLGVVGDVCSKNREDQSDIAIRAEDLDTVFPSLDKGFKQ